MLNSKGGIEADLTVTCIDQNKFRIVTGSSVRIHDKKHILKYLDNSVNFKDITDDYACLGIFGPKSRDLVSKVFGQNFSNDDFKFGTGKNIEFNKIQLWFQRISYVGELGWEIYIPIEKSKEIYEIIVSEEKNELPDLNTLRCFHVNGDTGITYNKNIWHHPLLVKKKQDFWVIDRINDKEDTSINLKEYHFTNNETRFITL